MPKTAFFPADNLFVRKKTILSGGCKEKNLTFVLNVY